MLQLFSSLLALLFFLSGPALEGNAEIWHFTLAAEEGLSQTYRLGLESSRNTVLAANRALYDDFVASGGRIIRDRSTTEFNSAGAQVLGRYEPELNTITLFRGSNLGTVSEELIHFGQLRNGGLLYQPIYDAGFAAHLERNAAITLKQWGFVPSP
jgi:hypothetical protein